MKVPHMEIQIKVLQITNTTMQMEMPMEVQASMVMLPSQLNKQ